MSSLKTLPYFLPKPDRIRQDAWQIEIDGKYEALQETLPTWDPGMPILAATTVELDVLGILQDCSLPEDAELRLSSGWFSSGSNLKGSGSRIRVSKQMHTPVTLQVEVEGIFLANQITLQTFLVAISPGSKVDLFAPLMPGSVLWEYEKVVHLEGISARFPTELIDFESASWLPANAAWFLDWNPDDFHMPVTAAVRLYINSKNERVKAAIAGGPNEDAAIREAISFDVARLLIISSVNNSDFRVNIDQFPKGTIGFAVQGLIRTIFPQFTIAELTALLEMPNRFDSEIQHGVHLFGKARA